MQLSIWLLLFLSQLGKWVVTPDYVLDSVKNGSWHAEEPYEIAIPTRATSAFYPVRQWREKVASGRIAGAFQGWRVLLMVKEPTRRAMFKRWGTLQNGLVLWQLSCQNGKYYFSIISLQSSAGFSKQARPKFTATLFPHMPVSVISWLNQL